MFRRAYTLGDDAEGRAQYIWTMLHEASESVCQSQWRAVGAPVSSLEHPESLPLSEEFAMKSPELAASEVAQLFPSILWIQVFYLFLFYLFSSFLVTIARCVRRSL